MKPADDATSDAAKPSSTENDPTKPAATAGADATASSTAASEVAAGAAAPDSVPEASGAGTDGPATGKPDQAGKDDKDDKDGEDGEDGEAGAAAATATATRRQRRYRTPFRRRLRMPPPRQLARTTVRATRDWSRRPGGRLTLPGVFLLLLVAVATTAGVLLVPATAREPRKVAADASASPDATAGLPGVGQPVPGGTGLPVVPSGSALPPGVVGPAPGSGRPADALADWAQRTGTRVGIAPVAMQAYGYAELVLAQSNPSCGLSWTTLAAIGFVESSHGRANGATLQPDGQALPEIIGDPLDGQGGRQRIMDTDGGQLDRDRVYDRAVGPMQFIPTTWQEIGADADGDGVRNPHDLDDAALAAGNYLCKGGRNLTIPGDWWNAILSYNDVRRYAQKVHDTANQYGLASRS